MQYMIKAIHMAADSGGVGALSDRAIYGTDSRIGFTETQNGVVVKKVLDKPTGATTVYMLVPWGSIRYCDVELIEQHPDTDARLRNAHRAGTPPSIKAE
jgi:hypothetical protein